MTARQKKQGPTLQLERQLHAQGYPTVAGIDEVGRGCLAGPVVAAAVILPLDEKLYEPGAPLWGICDSKQILPEKRTLLAEQIRRNAVSIGYGVMPPDLIDYMNIYHATRMAMMAALAELHPQPGYVLLDAMRLPGIATPHHGIIRGDATCTSIAAASIMAKVLRDTMMTEMEQEFPGYGFARHKGYGTAQHLHALAALGPCAQHRRSFAPVAQALMGLHDPAPHPVPGSNEAK